LTPYSDFADSASPSKGRQEGRKSREPTSKGLAVPSLVEEFTELPGNLRVATETTGCPHGPPNMKNVKKT